MRSDATLHLVPTNDVLDFDHAAVCRTPAPPKAMTAALRRVTIKK
jgi:hypothetical protein